MGRRYHDTQSNYKAVSACCSVGDTCACCEAKRLQLKSALRLLTQLQAPAVPLCHRLAAQSVLVAHLQCTAQQAYAIASDHVPDALSLTVSMLLVAVQVNMSRDAMYCLYHV
jgi:hypothetical protein